MLAKAPVHIPVRSAAIDDHTAVFTGNTSAMTESPMSTMLFTHDGRDAGADLYISTTHLAISGGPPPISMAWGTSYTSTTQGWILCTVGDLTEIIVTTDGGHTWHMQYKSSILPTR